VRLYQSPPVGTHALCVDEMGPISAKTYPAPRWWPHPQRPKVEADYGRRGKVWAFGAFEPGTDQAITRCTGSRNSANFVAFLEEVSRQWPAGKIVLIMDNLSIHKTAAVQYYPWHRLLERQSSSLSLA